MDRTQEMERELASLKRRLEIAERALALMLSSSGATWSDEWGLDFSRAKSSETSTMIMGTRPWDPGSLDKGG